VHVHQHHSGTGAVVVMDGDGEDRPEDVPRLLDALARGSGEQVVFAARTRRMESPLFRLFYQLFRGLSRLLTGHPVRVGNFSVLTPAALHRLVVVSELWNHYAAAVFRSRIRFGAIPLARGERYDGRSQMRFAELVRHGLSSISVFGDLVGVRLLVATAGLMVLAALGVAGALALRISSDALLPGWATTATGIGVVVLMLVYYRLSGLIGTLALTVNLLLLFAGLSALSATLTLPGIAGLALTVGMAVDANIIQFERIREELRGGKAPREAVAAGFEKAFSAILDANITTFIVVVILYAVGTGPIKGFAVTLSIGILTSMFTAIMGTRALVNLIYGGRRLRHLAIGKDIVQGGAA